MAHLMHTQPYMVHTLTLTLIPTQTQTQTLTLTPNPNPTPAPTPTLTLTLPLPCHQVHTTFQYGGAQGKRHRLRESMVWEDEPSYYAEPDFLHFDLDVTPNR